MFILLPVTILSENDGSGNDKHNSAFKWDYLEYEHRLKILLYLLFKSSCLLPRNDINSELESSGKLGYAFWKKS